MFLFVFLSSCSRIFCFFFNDTATTEIYTLSLHDALPICLHRRPARRAPAGGGWCQPTAAAGPHLAASHPHGPSADPRGDAIPPRTGQVRSGQVRLPDRRGVPLWVRDQPTWTTRDSRCQVTP